MSAAASAMAREASVSSARGRASGGGDVNGLAVVGEQHRIGGVAGVIERTGQLRGPQLAGSETTPNSALKVAESEPRLSNLMTAPGTVPVYDARTSLP